MITYGKAVGRRRVAALGVGVAALTLAVTACGNGSSGSSGSSPAPVPSANGEAVSAQATSLGTILVNGKGRTVYEFANDKNGASTCTGTCAANWPFVPAPTTLPVSLPGVTGQLGTTTRTDGGHQLTVANHPLYTFAGDSAPGQTNGQDKTIDGGLWTVVSGSGAAVTKNAGPAATTPAQAGNGY